METTDALWVVKTWTEGGKVLQEFSIRLCFTSKSSWEPFRKKGLVYFTVIYMVTPEEKTFSCTVTTSKTLLMQLEFSLTFYQSFVTSFRSIKVDFQWASSRNQQPEYQCITKYKSQIYSPWKLLSVELTEVQRKINILPQNIWCWQAKNF